jgi:uncharacterized protein (TIGR03435 family)
MVAFVVAVSRGQQIPQFEVVSVKPFELVEAVRQGGGTGFHVESGRVHCNCGLRLMIENAFNIRPHLMVGPPWLFNPKGYGAPEVYQLEARYAGDGSKQTVAAMMRQMLTERFHLSAHVEARDEPVYVLRVAPDGPKLTPHVAPPDGAVPAPRTALRMGINLSNGNVDIDGPVSIARIVAAINPSIDRQIIDETGLEGEFEIKLHARIPLSPLPPGMEFVHRPPEGTLPDGVPSIFTEIRSLGLELKASHAPIDHLIIDKVDKIPTEN